MTGNGIGDEGAKALSEGLKVNTTLTELLLGGERARQRNHIKEKENKKQAVYLKMKEQKH